MYRELGYINYFIDNGTYQVNWGTRYFAEIVNPIPRIIWPGKPMIGIDYAIARGMAYGNQDAKSGGIAASISTGMIGQGVVNFGLYLRADRLGISDGGLGGPSRSSRSDGKKNRLSDALWSRIGPDVQHGPRHHPPDSLPLVFGWILLNWYYKKKGLVLQPREPALASG